MQPVQALATLTALVFVLIGGIGLLWSTGTGLGTTNLFGLTLDPLQSWVYLDAGVLGLLWSLTSATARVFGWLLLLGGGLLFVWGLMLNGLITGNPLSRLGDPLELTVTDGWWHLVIAIVGLVLAVIPARKSVHLPRRLVTPTPATSTQLWLP
jgi:hypothetical protein